VQKSTHLPSRNPIFVPCFRELHFEFLGIAPQFLPFLAQTQINSLPYLDTDGFTRALWVDSVPSNGLETDPKPYLEQFESYM
jgi:hypothetical protein